MAVNDSGDVVVVGASSGGKSILKFNSSGTEQWSADRGATTCNVADASGNVYVGGAVSNAASHPQIQLKSGTQPMDSESRRNGSGILS